MSFVRSSHSSSTLQPSRLPRYGDVQLAINTVFLFKQCRTEAEETNSVYREYGDLTVDLKREGDGQVYEMSFTDNKLSLSSLTPPPRTPTNPVTPLVPGFRQAVNNYEQKCPGLLKKRFYKI